MTLIFSNLTLLSIFKFIFILFFIFLNLYLVYLEFSLYNCKAIKPKWKEAGLLDINIAKTLKKISSVSVGFGGLYGVQAQKQNRAATQEEITKLDNLESNIINLKKEVYESTILNQDAKSKMTSVALNIKDEINKASSLHKKLADNRNKLITKSEQIQTKDINNNEKLKGQIMKEIEALKQDNTYLEGEVQKSMIKTNEIVKELEGYNETKEAVFSFNLFEILDSYGPMEKFAFSILIFSEVILSAIISIVYIFYGEYLIKRFNIENRFPRLAKVIKLRRKFQSYYLLISIGWIVTSVLIEIYFCLMILTF
jgi:hypothetical protein